MGSFTIRYWSFQISNAGMDANICEVYFTFSSAKVRFLVFIKCRCIGIAVTVKSIMSFFSFEILR